jgi:S1-C subfamily serine protease
MQGESIVTYGFPLGQVLSQGGNLTDGSVSSTSGIQGNDNAFQISAPVQPGSSGGPVVDQTGAVVGIVVNKLNALAVAAATGDIAQNVNFATQARLLKALMDSKGVAYDPAGGSATRSNTELADLLQKATVKVECWR